MGEAQEPSAASERPSTPSSPARRASTKADAAHTEPDDRSIETRSDRPAKNYLTVIIDSDTAKVIRVDRVNAAGVAQKLSGDERTKLVSALKDDKLHDLVERAFEAGIACVLGGDQSCADTESPEDAELRRRLLAPLIGRSAVGRLLERGALNRAVLNTLISDDIS